MTSREGRRGAQQGRIGEQGGRTATGPTSCCFHGQPVRIGSVVTRGIRTGALENGKEPWCSIARGVVEYDESQTLNNSVAIFGGSAFGYLVASLWFNDGGADSPWSLSLEHLLVMLTLSLFLMVVVSARKPDEAFPISPDR